MTEELTMSEELIRDWLDKILDASLVGDFKVVKMYAKKIRKLALEDKKLVTN